MDEPIKKSVLIKWATVQAWEIICSPVRLHKLPIWGVDALAKTEGDLKILLDKTQIAYVDIMTCVGEDTGPDWMPIEVYPHLS